MNKTLIFALIGVILLSGVVLLSGCVENDKCAQEFQHITVGTQFNDGKCCEGLTPTTLKGFTGGAWCLSSKYTIACLGSSNGVEKEGIYAIMMIQEGGPRVLLEEMNCSSYDRVRRRYYE